MISLLSNAGSKVHSSNREDDYGKPFGSGDIVGCYLFLDDHDPITNQMRFFRNGKDQGIAYSGKDLPSGVYFPAISLYMQVSTTTSSSHFCPSSSPTLRCKSIQVLDQHPSFLHSSIPPSLLPLSSPFFPPSFLLQSE